MNHFLVFLAFLAQTLTPAAEKIAEKFSPDSLKAGTGRLIDSITQSTPREIMIEVLREFVTFGLKVLAALLIYLIGGWVIRRILKVLRKGFDRKKTDKTIVSFTTSLVSIGLWAILIIVTITTLGINTTSIAALLAAGGMAFGMAMSGTVQNFAGGIMILIFKPFKAGDYIEAQGYAGTVQEVNIVYTTLLTYDNKAIILPNGALSNGNVCNFSPHPLRRIERVFSVCYGTDLDELRKVIREIVEEDPRILDATTPGAADLFVGIAALNNSGVDVKVRVWVNRADYWGVLYDLTEAIYKRLPENGISFPFPQLDVHLKQ